MRRGDGDGSTVVFDHFLSGGRGMCVSQSGGLGGGDGDGSTVVYHTTCGLPYYSEGSLVVGILCNKQVINIVLTITLIM